MAWTSLTSISRSISVKCFGRKRRRCTSDRGSGRAATELSHSFFSTFTTNAGSLPLASWLAHWLATTTPSGATDDDEHLLDDLRTVWTRDYHRRAVAGRGLRTG